MPKLKPSTKVGWGIPGSDIRRVFVGWDMVPLVRRRDLSDLLNSVSDVGEKATSIVLDVPKHDFAVRVEVNLCIIPRP